MSRSAPSSSTLRLARRRGRGLDVARSGEPSCDDEAASREPSPPTQRPEALVISLAAWRATRGRGRAKAAGTTVTLHVYQGRRDEDGRPSVTLDGAQIDVPPPSLLDWDHAGTDALDLAVLLLADTLESRGSELARATPT